MQTETDVIFGRIVKAWCKYTRQRDNLNLNFGFGKGRPSDPDVSCTILLYSYPNYFRGTMTHCNGHELDYPVTDEWYALRRGRLTESDSEAPQYVVGFGHDIAEAMLAAEAKMHERFAVTNPKESP